MKKETELPMNISFQAAYDEINHALNAICVKYNLPGPIFDLMIEKFLLGEYQANVAVLTEQYCSIVVDGAQQPGAEKEESDIYGTQETAINKPAS